MNITNNHDDLAYLSFEPLLTLLSSEFLSKESQHNTFVVQYLSELLESSISELSEKHNELVIENQGLISNLIEIMQKEYSNLVAVIDHESYFSKSFDVLNESVNKIQSTIISINTKISNFKASKDLLGETFNQARLLYQYQEYISNILEIPSLIKTFIKNNRYSEAISLIFYVRQLESKYSQIVIVQDLVKQTNHISEDMQKQLLSLLRGPIKLTEATKVLGYLHRTNGFSETELCYIFLLCRWNYIEKLISNLNPPQQEDSGKYLKEYIEIFREHSFSIFSYYILIFLEESSFQPSENLENISKINKNELNGKAQKKKLLSNFALFMVSEIKNTLTTCVPYISEEKTKTLILNRIFNCGQSLAGIGVDFSLALVDIFGDEWDNDIKNYQKMIKNLDNIKT
ncbi:uncharacterized protein T551_03237 [Pneumocystis jirovecii RU7]|uniref:Conserved oligomeric Golgi complex subunit 8 n=1 Tax=Pneumocystis jirovecii (strain RU7) TaxID=1408657 RepID=A0A0W4ZFT0_PNEJ7|nr:uncharacterized protein T551_03237 [Pneumocystis jirovecii RU7]KTW27243.1 hypothetical protein T551_03237 [Pneumocystis jirovecii RU7]